MEADTDGDRERWDQGGCGGNSRFDAIKKQQQRRDGRRYAKQSSKAAGAETETKTKTQAQASNGHSPPLSKVP